MLCPVRLPFLPLDLGLARWGGGGGGGVPLDVRLLRASAPLSLQLLRELGRRGGGVARSQRTSPARAASSVASPRSSQHTWRLDESREVSVDRSFSRSSRVFRSSDRGTRKDRRARSRSDSSRDRGRRSRSRSAYRSRLSGRERRRRSSSRSLSSASGRALRIAPAPGAYALAYGETGLDPRIDTGLAETALGVTGRGLLTATDPVDSVRVPLRLPGSSRSRDLPRRSRDRSRSCGRFPPSSDRLRSKERGRQARREQQEGVETVAVSQAPAVSEAPAVAAPPAGGATMATLPSAVQDLARFFLSLSGSSSLGAVGGVAGVAAPASGVGVQLCPSAPGGGAVAPCAATAVPAGVGGPPSASAAVPGSSGHQQHQETSRPSRRRRLSSSDGTGRASKKRPRGRPPSPSPSFRYQERSYRSSSESSEDAQAVTSPLGAGRAPGGTPGDSRPAPAGGRSPRPGPSGRTARSSAGAGAERYRSGGGRRSPAPSGVADDDRSSSFESMDFDRDDFPVCPGPHPELSQHGRAGRNTISSVQDFSASIYGLMSETSPAFHLPTSPLMLSLLDDTNLALSKFLEDQTVHGFLPVPGRRHRRYYCTSSSSFLGPYSVPPGVTSITLEKASEARKRSISLSASQVSSMETMLSGVCVFASWLDWWLSTCGDFCEHLSDEVCADFERLMLSEPRAL